MSRLWVWDHVVLSLTLTLWDWARLPLTFWRANVILMVSEIFPLLIDSCFEMSCNQWWYCWMTSFDFSTFHSADDMICLSNEIVSVFADPVKWMAIWRHISSPVTGPVAELDVRMILLTMTFGSPEIAWSNVYRWKKSALSRVDLFCSSFPLKALSSVPMSWISFVRSWTSWGLFSAWVFHRFVSFLTWSSLFPWPLPCCRKECQWKWHLPE